MNKSYKDGLKTIKTVRKKIINTNKKKYVILPPLQSILYIKNNLFYKDVLFGSQDCSQFKNGAITGDVSAEMIRQIGCKYILIGHSERRSLFNESSKVLIRKLIRAKEQKLKVIFCVGESFSDYNKGNSAKAIIKQLLQVFNGDTNFNW